MKVSVQLAGSCRRVGGVGFFFSLHTLLTMRSHRNLKLKYQIM